MIKENRLHKLHTPTTIVVRVATYLFREYYYMKGRVRSVRKIRYIFTRVDAEELFFFLDPFSIGITVTHYLMSGVYLNFAI